MLLNSFTGGNKMGHHHEIYRGYDIESHPKEGYVIRKNGEVISSQPSIEFCYIFIDGERKKQMTK